MYDQSAKVFILSNSVDFNNVTWLCNIEFKECENLLVLLLCKNIINAHLLAPFGIQKQINIILQIKLICFNL